MGNSRAQSHLKGQAPFSDDFGTEGYVGAIELDVIWHIKISPIGTQISALSIN